jgi:aromatic ring-cleaving dioxygenase
MQHGIILEWLTLTNSGFDVTLSPTSIEHKNGQNYTIVYTITAKPDIRGIYNIGLAVEVT